MIRVKPLDALYVYSESDRVSSAMVSAYAFAESDATTEELVQWLADRASGIPELRQRMVRAYGDIGDAYWSEAPAFDPRDHISATSGMSWDELRMRIAGTHRVVFDSSRPLWSAEIVRHVGGIEPAHGRECVVVILKCNHAITDGLGFADVARKLFSSDVSSCEVGQTVSRGTVTALESARLVVRPFLVLSDVWRLLKTSRQRSKDRRAGLWSMPDFEPRSSAVNQAWSGEAVTEVVYASVSELRQAAKRIGEVSVNDLVLAAIGGAAARHLGEEHLAAAVPISIRDISAEARNATAIAIVDLRVDLPAAERCVAIHANVARERARFRLPSWAESCQPDILPRLPGFVYRGLAAWQRRSGAHAKPGFTQLKVSTVPKGPADEWVLAGSPVVANFGAPPLADGLGLNHSVSRLGDVLGIAFVYDPKQLPAPDGYARCLRAELAALTGADAM
ncbi:hypothetical protein GP2_011_00290 [Gordonia paraffinivorans NBRC 108238]|uniref:Diacylglycerol O-acyltransferase n=1 Tax=Gordonia paraffinivorans NBRC 108238 TaxID=1223543 RepID=A0ABQ0IIA2_9ACTN|nr:wax ester/triacylglycerol synthase domain-containing protein [Gordonia paraffinivorans]GAC83303.1 hypothetical protein GP2_011_00290 [Gordonia paraffinivorans NBRC 108238]